MRGEKESVGGFNCKVCECTYITSDCQFALVKFCSMSPNADTVGYCTVCVLSQCWQLYIWNTKSVRTDVSTNGDDGNGEKLVVFQEGLCARQAVRWHTRSAAGWTALPKVSPAQHQHRCDAGGICSTHWSGGGGVGGRALTWHGRALPVLCTYAHEHCVKWRSFARETNHVRAFTTSYAVTRASLCLKGGEGWTCNAVVTPTRHDRALRMVRCEWHGVCVCVCALCAQPVWCRRSSHGWHGASHSPTRFFVSLFENKEIVGEKWQMALVRQAF